VRLALETLEDRTAPAVLTVTSAADMHQDGLLTLREAVALANADASSGQSDAIDFDADLGNATITLAAGQLELSGVGGNATETIDGAGRITVSGNHASRVFRIDAGVHAELDGLTITDGRALNVFDTGGGIYNAGTLTVAASTLSGNSAPGGGGGIYNAATLTVSDSTVSANSGSGFTTEDDGGGIANASTAMIRHCTISNNSAVDDGLGGGLSNAGSMTVSDSTIDGNTASYGGGGIENLNLLATLTVSNTTFAGNSTFIGAGIDNEFGTLTVSNATFTSNTAKADGGGGIYNYEGRVTVSNSTFAGNSAGYGGGGIYSENGSLTVSNSTFAANSVHQAPGGGGIYSDTGTLTVSNTTFTGDSAPAGGGIYNNGPATLSNSTVTGNTAMAFGGGAGGGILNGFYPLTLSNSIVAGNFSSFGPDLDGPVEPLSRYNLIGNGNGLTGIRDGVNHNQIGTPANPIDPLLAPFGNYGGPTQTFALLAGSPALAAGGASATLTSPVNATAISLNVDSAAALAVSPGLTIQIDSEQLLITAVNTTSNTFTVVRGVNGTAAVAHDAGAGLFPAADQRGAPRVVNGSLDIGSYQSQPATRLVLSVSGPVSAGAAFTLTVTAYDAYGNVTIGYTGTVAFVSTDPDAQLPQDYPFSASDAGTHDFVTTLHASGSTVTLVVRDSTNDLTASLDVLVS
jgi:predicted outer membrane repeat protein